MRTSVASLSGVSTPVPARRSGAGCAPLPATWTTALVRIGLAGVTAGNPATSTMAPGRTSRSCSVSIRAPPVPSSTYSTLR